MMQLSPNPRKATLSEIEFMMLAEICSEHKRKSDALSAEVALLRGLIDKSPADI